MTKFISRISIRALAVAKEQIIQPALEWAGALERLVGFSCQFLCNYEPQKAQFQTRLVSTLQKKRMTKRERAPV